MATINKIKGIIGVLTGGGDVPGLNPAIRAVTLRANYAGFKVIGFRRGWAGITEMIRDEKADNSNCYQVLTDAVVNRENRNGGTFLHTSRTRPSHMPKASVPDHLKASYNNDVNDLTPEVIKNLEWLGIDYLVPIGGDDTLSYAVHLHNQGVKVVAVPKTMDNDIPGTDYCIGFSTCITRTIELSNALRTTACSHERILVLEVFGRYAGFTAMLPTMAGAADRCVIPEYKFDINLLAELLVRDRSLTPNKYSIVIVSEGATYKDGEMIFEDQEKDAYGHAKLGGIGEKVASQLKDLSAKYNGGKKLGVISQKLGYMVRGGDPDAFDSIIPMAYGNIAFDLILKGISGRFVVLQDGHYDHIPISIITSKQKKVSIAEHYDIDRLRPYYNNLEKKPFLILVSD